MGSPLAEGFTESVRAELKVDIAPLGGWPRDAFDALVGIVLRLIIDPIDGGVNSSAVVGAVKAFAKEHEVAALAILQRCVRGLVVFLQEAARIGSTGSDVRHGAEALGLEMDAARALGDAWMRALVSGDDTAALPDGLGEAVGLRRLIDLQWKFCVTAASSEADASSVGQTFLQLKLVLDAPTGDLEVFYLELSLDQFYELLAHMERAKAALTSVLPGPT